MRILFIHQNMPGQYRGLMPHYAANPENEVYGIGEVDNIKKNFARIPERLKLLGYQMPPMPPYVGHSYMRNLDPFIYRGEMVAKVLVDLKKQGVTPDVICAHPGWGESLYIKDVFPDARLIEYCEFYYHSKGQDYGFDPEFPEPLYSEWGLRTRNAIQLLSLPSMDIGVSPTRWQATRYPAEYQPKIEIVHEGVKTNILVPDETASITIKERNLTLTPKDEVITFVNRNFEPYRGFHVFMRALPEILARRPNAHVIMVGGDEVSYGKHLSQGTYRQWLMSQVGANLDLSRVHFVGKIPYPDYIRVLQVSTAHVYLTYPFVLSWSMLEAMSAGCLVIGSKTTPVTEVLKHEDNGLLVDFFNKEELIAAIDRACDKRKDMNDIRKRARQHIIDTYDFETICLPKHLQLIEKGRIESVAPIVKKPEVPVKVETAAPTTRTEPVAKAAAVVSPPVPSVQKQEEEPAKVEVKSAEKPKAPVPAASQPKAGKSGKGPKGRTKH